MCNLKLKELIEKTVSEIQLQIAMQDKHSVEKHKNSSCNSRRHTLDCPRSLDQRLISRGAYVSNHSSKDYSFSTRSLLDLDKICSECGNSGILERHTGNSLELSGEVMKPFYHMWSRRQEDKVIGRGKLAPPRALTRQGIYRECGCFTRDFLQSSTGH